MKTKDRDKEKVFVVVVALVVVLVPFALWLFTTFPKQKIEELIIGKFQKQKIEETVEIPDEDYGGVNVVGTQPSDNGELDARCMVDYAGTFFDTKRREHVDGKDLAIIDYENPRDIDAAFLCKNGTLFAISAKTMERLYARNTEKKKERREDAELVKSAQNRAGPVIPRADFTWVIIENDRGNANKNEYFHYHDACSLVDSEGPFLDMGPRERDGIHLIKYAGESGQGSDCAQGTLFWATIRSVQ